jgi:hypothetical protein
MTTARSRTPVEELLVEGLDDWLYASWITTPIRSVTTVSHRRTMALGLIAEMLVDGLMVAGDVVDGRHQAWPCSTGEAIERITRVWLQDWRDELPTPGAIVWFDITDKGADLARQVLAREGEQPPTTAG